MTLQVENEIQAHWLYQAVMQSIRPPDTIDCLTWNRKNGRLSARDSATPGVWSDIATPYVCHWLDIASARKLGRAFMADRDPYAHLTEQIWVVKGSQVGMTRSILLSILGWLMDQQAGPTGYFLPRVDDLAETQRERLLPFFEESPALSRLIPTKGTESRKTKVTQEAWHLDTGTIYFLASSIANDLRSRPLCDGFWDEFDLSPTNCQGQGDAIDLGLDRQKTFGRRRLTVGVTTPTLVTNPGWRRLISGSHERLLVDCLECQASQELSWDGLRILIDQKTITLAQAVKAGLDEEKVKVSSLKGTSGLARWACAHCGRLHTTTERDRIVLAACKARQWVPGEWTLDEKNPTGLWTPWADFDAHHHLTNIPHCETTVRTGHLHSLYSGFVKLEEAAAKEMKLLRVGTEDEWISFRNNWRAEPTLPMSTQNAEDPSKILEIIEHKHPKGTAPAKVQKILITCDQQENERTLVWFPYVVRGWGPNGESWLIDTGQVQGWEGLEDLESILWTVGQNQQTCDAICVDGANGNVRVDLQQWAQAKASKRMILHGLPNQAIPIVQRFARDPRKVSAPGRRLLPGVRYYYTKPDAWKTMLNDRLKKSPGLAGWHLCAGVPDAYLASLGSENQVQSIDKNTGRPKTVWRPRVIITKTGKEEERKDTHWWDCEHMQLAAAHVLKWDQLQEPEPETQTAAPANGGFMDGFSGNQGGWL